MRRFIAVLQVIVFTAVIFVGVGAPSLYADNGQPLLRNPVEDHHADKTPLNHFVYLFATDLEEKESFLKFKDIKFKPYSVCSLNSNPPNIMLKTFNNSALRQLSITVILS